MMLTRELEEQAVNNSIEIQRKADELKCVISEKLEENTRKGKVYADVCEKAADIAEKLHETLSAFKALERDYPALTTQNAKLEKAIEDLNRVIAKLKKETEYMQTNAFDIISEHNAELSERLDRACAIPALQQQRGTTRQIERS